MKLQLRTEIEMDHVINAVIALEDEQAIELIVKIDDWMADSSFTEALIKRLVIALKGDVGEDVHIPFIDWDKVPSKP